MELRQRIMAASVAVAAAATPTTLSAPTSAHAAVVSDSISAIDTYFRERDQAWGGTARPGNTDPDEPDLSPQALQRIEDVAEVADDYRTESGNSVTRVTTDTSSNLVSSACIQSSEPSIDDESVCTSMTEIYETRVGTTLNWSAPGAPETFIGDSYTVKLMWTRSAADPETTKSFSVMDVSLTPGPTDTDSGPSAAALGIQPADTDRTAGLAAQAKIRKADKTIPGREKPTANLAAAAAGKTFSPDKAAAYAIKWANGFNPDYDRQDNDCTNFVSQALKAGGWETNDGVDPDDKVNWHPDLWGPRGPSKTWTRASWLMEYATTTSKRGVKLSRAQVNDGWNSLWTLYKGDIVFTDWGPNGTDGQIDHVMIVTGQITQQGFTEPTISQHSSARKNIPISVSLKLASQEWKKPMHYYPVRTKVRYNA